MHKNIMDNPCGLKGFAFLEFSGPNQQILEQQFIDMGFQANARHAKADITRYQQGDIQFILNAAPHTQAAHHAKVHGPGACAMGFRVKNAQSALEYALAHGAKAIDDDVSLYSNLPGIEAIGGSIIYFVEDNNQDFAADWATIENHHSSSVGLLSIDHLTHNVFRGNMDTWARFYETIFNFHEIRFFNITGQMSGLISRALASPCGMIKIPLNESKDDVSQIEEFLHDYQGEGIQHIALSTKTIYDSVHRLRQAGVVFLDVPDTYYEMIATRIPWHQESLTRLQEERILIDGEKDPQHGLLLQIFTENIFGPVFFEIIERHGNQGFGEGNFQALFEAIERDQLKRGTLNQKQSEGMS